MAQSRTAGLNIRVIEDKEVLFHFGDNPAIDLSTGTFGEGWESGGLEPGDSSWEVTREITSNKTNLTAGQTTTSHVAGGLTGTANLIPGSAALDYIDWPETTVKDGTLYRKHSAVVARAHVARVHRFQGDIIGMKVSREKADLNAATRTDSNDPSPRAVTIDYVNGADGYAFEERYYHVNGAGEVTEVQPKIFKTIADLDAQVQAGTAFKSDAAKGNLTAMVPVAKKSGDATLHEFEGETTSEEEGTTGGTEDGGTGSGE